MSTTTSARSTAPKTSSDDHYEPHRIEAELEKAKTGVLVRFQYDGEECTRLAQFTHEQETLKQDAIPDEEGISDMEEAIDEAERGWTVSVRLHEERARLWSVADLAY